MTKTATGLLAWLLLMPWVAPRGAAAIDTAFVDALRRRGLVRLAEAEARSRLAAKTLTRRAEAEWIAVLSQLDVDRALAAPANNREGFWRSADRRLADALGAGAENLPATPGRPELLLLRLQRAVNRCTRGEVTRLEAAAGRRADAADAARVLHEGDRLLRSVAGDIQALRRVAPAPARRGAPAFTAAELDLLAARVCVKRADNLAAVADCYAAGSPDRDDALLRAAELARRSAGQSLPTDLRWRSRVTLARVERGLGRNGASLAALESERPPPREWAGGVLAERWRTLLADGRASEAEAVLASAVAGPHAHSAGVWLAELEALAARWADADGAARASLAESIRRRLSAAARRRGPLAVLRAEGVARDVLLAAVPMSSGSPPAGAGAPPMPDESLDGLVASAEFLYRSGRPGRAVEVYDRASAAAFRVGARGRSLELQLAAAAIQQSRREYADASRRFRRAALAHASHPSAAQAHRAAAACAALAAPEAGRGDETGGADKADYVELLEEHLRTWPRGGSAGEVRWWLIGALMQDGQWRDATERIGRLPDDDPRLAEAMRLARRAWGQRIAAAAVRPAEAGELLEEALTGFQHRVLGEAGAWPSQWSAAQREAALAAAALKLVHDPSAAASAYAARMLQAAATGDPAPTAGWRSAAAPLLAAAYTRQDRFASAREALADGGQRSPWRGQAVAGGQVLLDELREAMRRRRGGGEAGRLALQVLDRIDPAVDESWRAPYRTAALAATGQIEEAVAAARRSAEGSPDSGRAQRRLAALLSTLDDDSSRREALTRWRQIERRSVAGAPGWFDARLNRIRLMRQLGDGAAAAKLLRLTEVLHPRLGGRSEEFRAAASVD